MKKNAPPFGVDAHNPHTDNSPFREIPQRISHTPQHAQKEEAEQKQSSAEPAAQATGSRGKTNRTITKENFTRKAFFNEKWKNTPYIF